MFEGSLIGFPLGGLIFRVHRHALFIEVGMKINEKRVVEVIGRLIGRANSHKNAAAQTPNKGKADAHLSAYGDLMSLASDLANATDDPECAKSKMAYRWAVDRSD